MTWQIPAKTFLLGEYVAIEQGPAIILTTTPAFELTLAKDKSSIHPDSPAGKFWKNTSHKDSLIWRDPYDGKGGLGASSAQFIGAYLADCYLSQRSPTVDEMFDHYLNVAWDGQGLRPSGYDVLAQASHQCVYINYQQQHLECFTWRFTDIGFILVHSGEKLATHHHLQSLKQLPATSGLASIVKEGKRAFDTSDSNLLQASINAYQQQLAKQKLTAPEALIKIEILRQHYKPLAIKGCGALGMDVFLLIFPQTTLKKQQIDLASNGWTILATTENLYQKPALIKKITDKT